METYRYPALKFQHHHFTPVEDILAVEEMLSIHINDRPFTITMRTPGYEADLIRGLLFSEQIYCDLDTDPVLQVVSRSDEGFITGVNVEADEALVLKNYSDKRNIVSVSSCGICGKTELDLTPVGKPVNHHETFLAGSLPSMFEAMNKEQQSFRQSGGVHAAAAFTLSGKMLAIREDIGRHNAVDKVIGSLLLSKQLDKARCLLVSGRVSYEIVSKTYLAGIPFLAAVSAPSSMAVDFCKNAGITLMAFCRNDYFTVYSHPEAVQS